MAAENSDLSEVGYRRTLTSQGLKGKGELIFLVLDKINQASIILSGVVKTNLAFTFSASRLHPLRIAFL